MAAKLQRVSELADRTARRVTRDAGCWKDYLEVASRLYRYGFDEQLLIYAQRPDATACATMETWNNKMRRWIRAGSKGIALIRKSGNGRKRLEYVFDMADTRPVRGAREPNLWEMREEYHAPVLAMLEKRYGSMDGQDLGDALMEASARAVDGIYEDCLKDLEYDLGGSFLEGLDRESLALCFRETLTASVQYGVLARCGLDPMEYMDGYGLGAITQFSTPAALHHLGDACSAATMEVCMEIRREVRRAERAAWKNRRGKGKKSLEKTSAPAYSNGRGKFNDLKRESKRRRSRNGRTDIHEGGGLLNLKITYTYSLPIHCLQIPRRNQTIQKRSFCR